MSDESIIVKQNGAIFLGSLPLLRSVTAENLTADDLGNLN